MLDFLFITSPSNARNPHPPYYFMYLASYLREKGLKVKILDPKGRDTPVAIDRHKVWLSEQVLANPSRFIGISAFHNDWPMVQWMGRMARICQPNATIIVGNAHPTIKPEDFIYPSSPFHVAILGEGEETCWELHQEESMAFPNYHNIRGVAFWQPEGDYFYGFFEKEYMIKTEPRHFMDLKDLPMPAYDLINMDYYLKPQKLVIRRIYTSMMPIYAGRGCAWNCSFCAANSVWKANVGRSARLRPVDDVIEEIRYLRDNYHVDFFYIFDDTFGMSKRWMKEWFDKKYRVDDPLHPVPYACQTRANLIDEKMMKGLKETGCIQIDIGLETGAQRLLDRVRKGITVQQVRRVAELARQYNIRVFYTMLLNLPGESKRDLNATWNLLRELKPSAGVIFGITTPYPGTEIYERDFAPKLTKDEYHLLTGNRLDPHERFRLAAHDVDLERLFNKWNRKFKATPIFERMWCLNPFQGLYWRTVLSSKRRGQYLAAWGKDLFKTFFIYWLHTLRIYRWVKRVQYGDNV